MSESRVSPSTLDPSLDQDWHPPRQHRIRSPELQLPQGIRVRWLESAHHLGDWCPTDLNLSGTLDRYRTLRDFAAVVDGPRNVGPRYLQIVREGRDVQSITFVAPTLVYFSNAATPRPRLLLVKLTGDRSGVSAPSDVLLVRRPAGRDVGAFEMLLRRYQLRVVRSCVRMLEDPHVAEDAAQDVFLVALRRWGGFGGRPSFRRGHIGLLPTGVCGSCVVVGRPRWSCLRVWRRRRGSLILRSRRPRGWLRWGAATGRLSVEQRVALLLGECGSILRSDCRGARGECGRCQELVAGGQEVGDAAGGVGASGGRDIGVNGAQATGERGPDSGGVGAGGYPEEGGNGKRGEAGRSQSFGVFARLSAWGSI
jgi:hypothetical protein